MAKTPAEQMQEAIIAARELDVDRIVRTIAWRGKGDDNNKSAFFDGKMFSASDCGTCTAKVITEGGVLVYQASDCGRYIEVFRNGPWVGRAALEADRIKRLLEAERTAKDMEAAEQMNQSFAPYQD
jgi:hypothetical protein